MNSTNIVLPPMEAGLAALDALKRAGLRAAQDALRTNTEMVLAENGTVERVKPQDYLREREHSSLDAVWREEAEARRAAHRRGEVRAVALSDVVAKYHVTKKTV